MVKIEYNNKIVFEENTINSLQAELVQLEAENNVLNEYYNNSARIPLSFAERRIKNEKRIALLKFTLGLAKKNDKKTKR